MEVLALVSPKGGAGKTALTVALAVEAIHAGRVACVVDLDPQASSDAWAQMRDRREILPAVVTAKAQASRLGAVLDRLRSLPAPPDVVLVDTPAALLATAGTALRLADRALAPVTPSLVDLEASRALTEMVTGAGFAGAQLTAVLNRVRARGGRALQARQWLERIAGLDVLSAEIGDRVIWPDSFASGLAPRELDQNAPGTQELAGLAVELGLADAETGKGGRK